MSSPRTHEFRRFIKLLTADAPGGYTPWLFRIRGGSKAPETKFGSWKDDDARLSVDEALNWMKGGGNIGIAGRPDDPLINVDIDDEDETAVGDLKPTLTARSRSRTGVHAWYFEAPGAEIPNIPTDEAGEVRANWQYVVAPGSYVDADPDDVPEGEEADAGFYTVEREEPVTSLRLEELPEVFRRADEPDPEKQSIEAPDPDFEPERSDEGDDDRRSALFEIEAADVVRKEGGSTKVDDRWPSLFHGSETDENMALSDRGLLHCWRHNVAHNGLQALAVLSDYPGACAAVGSSHKGANAGESCLNQEEGAHLWHAWKYAKENGYIPDDDPVPYAALMHLCRERGLCAVTELPDGADETIPAHAYDSALSTIKEHDGLDPGRQATDEIDDSGDQADDSGQATASADGGAVTAESGGENAPTGGGDAGDGGDGGEDDADAWAAVYQQYAAADNADERLPARYEATQLLDERGAWRHVVESGVLWRYDADVGLFRSDGEDSARERLVDGLREQFRGHEQREIVEQLRGRNTVSKDQMGGPDGAVLTANCVLEIGRDEIDTRTPSPDDEFMARVETEFDPDAECPRWRAFLKEVLPKGSDRKKVQEFAGYMLHHWGLPHHKALFLVGPTASGKSTLLDTLRAMLGSDSVAALTPQQMAGERFSGAELRGAWANIRNDIPAGLIENVGQLKEIIGGDPIKAERKRKDPFMFEPSAKHAFSANQLPDAEVNDEAFFRRILLVPVPDTVPRGERDPALDDKLQAELPGILTWALDGLQRLLKQGRFTADRSPGETQRTWEKWGHSIDRFRETCLEEASGDAIPKADLYSAYIGFCDDEGIPVSSQHKMTRQLKRSGLEDGRQSVNGERQRCILGVDWSSRGEQYAPDDSAEGRPSGLGEH